jgi:hypothetical protein
MTKLVGSLVKCGNETLSCGNRDREEEFIKGEINLHNLLRTFSLLFTVSSGSSSVVCSLLDCYFLC